MSSPVPQDLVQAFRADFREKVEALAPILAAAHDTLGKPALDGLFQLAHFLSGFGATVGYPFLSAIGRDLESFFSRLARGQVPVTPEMHKIALDIYAGLRSLSAALDKGALRPEDHEALFRQIVIADRELRGADDAEASARPRKKILVVDDEQLAHALIAGSLRNAGFDVVSCTDAREALSYMELEKPDLILLDVVMPGMDGFELLKRMRQGEGLLPIPVIFVTTQSQLNEKLLALKTGADDYITKPFLPEELVARVGARIERYEHLKELAVRDPLTGLYNHRYFQERIGEEIRRWERYKRPFSLALVDIDRFKQINDTHGHLVGDILLRQIARVMQDALRATDLVARYGGDEFVIVFPETDAPSAVYAMEKLKDRLKSEVLGKDPRFAQVSFSAGVASCPTDGTERSVLIERADQALYRAKHEGRDRIRAGPGPQPDAV